MKYLIIGILSFIAINCFAVNQKLIDGAKQYDIAKENLKKIEFDIKSEHRVLESWSKKLDKNKSSYLRSDDMEEFYKRRIGETQEKISILDLQCTEANKITKKLEPIKNEYDKLLERELNRAKLKTAILNFMGMLGLPLSIFALILWGIIHQRRKYKYLLQEGKIIQEEYDRIMTQHVSSTSSNNLGINPATGLPMTGIGISDVGGNVRGSSSTSNSFDYSRDYSSSHKWD